jgi:hypothetical protein
MRLWLSTAPGRRAGLAAATGPGKWSSCAVRPGPTGYCSVKRLLGPGRRVILMAEGDPDEGGFDAGAGFITSARRNAGVSDAEDGSNGRRS